jgi:2,3-bisphosphoglycerate-independent phosphoglycerate mutase
MEKANQNIQEVIDFIFAKPEVVVRLLQEADYQIEMSTATFQQIDKLTFEALENKDEKFAYSLADAIINGDTYLNAVVLAVGAVVSLSSALIGSARAKKEAKKQRELMLNLKMAEIASNEKLFLEQLRAQEETKRLGIVVNSLGQYREALQKESTIRLRDSWIYIVGLASGIGILYGLYLMTSKSKTA